MDGTDELLMQFVARGGKLCPICSYSLNGLLHAKCPECGEPLELTLRGESSRRVEWLTGLVAWSAGFGLYGIFVPLARLTGSGPPLRFWSFYLGMVITWPGLLVWLIIAKKFRRWDPRVRRILAGASLAGIIALCTFTALQLR
ncbi:MAG: hypothetical protein JSR77_00115 [Planctomycetes bacterium]|nr:hypothetical protein [Planctomycetota bacterium]